MKIGICASPSQIASWNDSSAPSFDYVEINVQASLKPEAADDVFAAEAQAAGLGLASSTVGRTAGALPFPALAANCFLPGDLKVTGPAVDAARLARYADKAFQRAAAVGIRHIVFGSGGARQVPEGFALAEGFEQYVEALRVCAPLAEKHGVVLVVEPLNRGECNLVNTVLEGAAAVARVNRPGVRLLVDIFHMLRNGESPDDIVKAGPWIAHAHVAECEIRSAPGVKGDDFGPFLRALKRAGYAGALSLECHWSPSAADMCAEAAQGLQVIRKQLAAAGF
ncbi:sugar phosphate isomerase/epimerase family protein, partial [Geminisphaera colitermitum]|uniref:sugar phosphate isomerase/epimerase family protein n=1 Tax=Geminisphaera colitermitum TaxID=1148786 RepID=UPI000158CF5F